MTVDVRKAGALIQGNSEQRINLAIDLSQFIIQWPPLAFELHSTISVIMRALNNRDNETSQ